MKLVAAQQERRTAEAPKRFSLFTRPLLAGFLALLIIALAFTLYVANETTDPDEGTLISKAEVPAGRPITIELEYEAARDIAQVTVTIELEAGLSFYSDIPDISSRKTISWSGPLKQGRNAVPFVVTAAHTGTWRIATTAEYDGLRHRHRVILSADGYKVVIAQYRLSSEELNEQVN
jgi:hypothetical protein